MSLTLPPDVVEEALARYPPPIADAVRAVECAESLHERRDRVVECFRAVVRFAATVALAARVRDGPGPGGESDEARSLLDLLLRRALTDGQWVALCRELLRPWARRPAEHPVPRLVALFHGSKRSRLVRNIDGLLRMRRAETVAHGGTGQSAELNDVLERRLPQLEAVLHSFAPLLRDLRVVVPRAHADPARAQAAALLTGDTPGRGTWRRAELAHGAHLPVGQPALVDAAGRPVLPLRPAALVPTPRAGVAEELFLLDGAGKGVASYVALPSRAEHRERRARVELAGALSAPTPPSDAAEVAQAQARSPQPRRAARLAAGALAVGALAVAVYAWHGRRVAEREVQEAAASERVQRNRSRAAQSRTDALALANRIALARARAARERDPTESLAWLKEMDPEGPGAGPARILAVEARRRGVARRVLRGHTDWISALAYSPDGAYLASAGGDGSIRVWNPKDGASTLLAGHSGPVLAVAIAPDGRSLASGGADSTVRLWSLRDGSWASRVLEGHGGWVGSVAFSPDGALLVSGSRDASIRLWDLRSPDRAPRQIGGHQGPVTDVAFSPNGREVASAGTDRKLRLWDVSTGRESFAWAIDDEIERVLFTPDATELLAVAENGDVRRFVRGAEKNDWRPAPVAAWPGGTGGMRGLALSPDGGAAATVGVDDTVRIRDLPSGSLRVLAGHAGRVTAMAFSPDGSQLASAGVDGTVRLWDRASAAGRRLGSHDGISSAVAWSPDGSLIATTGFDRAVRLWRPDSAERRVFDRHAAPLHCVAFDPRGDAVASAGADGGVRLRDLRADRLHRLRGHTGVVWSIAFSPDGERLASASEDGTVRVWQRAVSAPGAEPRWVGRTLESHAQAAVHVAFSPNGRWLATADWDGIVRLWNLEADTSRVLPGNGEVVARVAWSPNGRYLAGAGWDGVVRVHDVSAAKTSLLRGHSAEVFDVAFSPDGTRLASASGDATVRVWALAAESPVAVFRGHRDEVTRVSFAGDSNTVISASRDHSIRIWDVDSGQGSLLGEHDNEVVAIAVAPDGRSVASVGDDQSVRLWSVEVPRDLRDLLDWLDETTAATAASFTVSPRLL